MWMDSYFRLFSQNIQLLTTLSNSNAYFHEDAQIYNFWVFIEHFCHPVSKNRFEKQIWFSSKFWVTGLVPEKFYCHQSGWLPWYNDDTTTITIKVGRTWWYHYCHNKVGRTPRERRTSTRSKTCCATCRRRSSPPSRCSSSSSWSLWCWSMTIGHWCQLT